MRPLLPAMVLLACACGSSAPRPDGGSQGGTGGGDAGGQVAGLGLFARLPGVWTGQAASTPLGSFPEITMDIRPADSHWLFGRVDLDDQNDLRYGFAVEDLPGGPTLVFRNGGYFQGMLRDNTTALVDCDEDAGVYHFCAQANGCMYVNESCVDETGGCAFIDATFTFTAPDQLTFHAKVNGADHEIWTARRAETREVPSPFPQDPTPLPASTGWPALPQLAATVSWSQPLSSPTDVWVILSDTPCAPSFACTPLRTLFTVADAGATSAGLLFDQILPGSYDGNALVDLSGNFQTALAPSAGDLIAAPPDQSITVPASGQGTASFMADFTFP